MSNLLRLSCISIHLTCIFIRFFLVSPYIYADICEFTAPYISNSPKRGNKLLQVVVGYC